MSLSFIPFLILVILLIAAVQLQPGESGMASGGGMFGGGENFHTRRGLEKFLFYATFVLIAVFAAFNLWLIR